jgi:ribonuclease R
MSKRNTKGKKLTPRNLAYEIIRLFKVSSRKQYNAKQIIKKLKIENNVNSVQAALDKLVEDEKIKSDNKSNKYQLNKPSRSNDRQGKATIGILDMTRTGAGFVVSEDSPDNDIYIPSKHLNNALDGDTVKVNFFQINGKKRPEGAILDVIERATDHFIGTLNLSETYAFMIPDKLNMFMDIFVPLSDVGGAKNGDKVVVRVEKWPTRTRKSPVGVVTESLGEPGSSDVEMKSILISNGFELSFTDEVNAEADALTDVVTEQDILERRDFRPITTFTIDPLTAKDFDDAISIDYLENGHCEIGVHIADVTHYVRPGTELDKEAFKRSTSVYLVDRVLPMLPENISNGLCSLRPNEDKFTFSAVFTFDKNNQIVNEWFGRTLIHSDRRFTYEEAQERIETGEGDYATEILALNKLAHILRKKRYKEGSISFESPEIRFQLNEEGEPVTLYVKERKDAHKLVEDFMLLANKHVAKFVGFPKEGQAKVPFVYRVHDLPDFGKVEDFAKFARALGANMNINTPEEIAAAFNQLNELAITRPELKVLSPLAIRTMSKAEYATENIGHYGLGFKYYTHFTSPIRRYSDVLVHRLLALNLDKPFRVKEDELSEQCKHISRQERKATDAERQSIKYKQVEYMQSHIGQSFDGIINGFSDRGMFVEMTETLCEGMVMFDSMYDKFTLEEGRLSIKGTRTGDSYKMGDAIRVKVTSTNLQKRQIDLELEA